MNKMTWLALVLLAILIALPGCGGSKTGGGAPEGPGSGPLGAAIRGGGDIAITDASGAIVVVIGDAGGQARLVWQNGGAQVEAVATATADGAEYRDAGGAILAAVMENEGGFTVVAEDRKWPVSVTPGAIEVGGGASPFALKTQNENKFLIFSGGSQIGYLKYYPDQSKIKVKDMGENSQFKSNTTRVSAMYGMMMMPEISSAARYAVMAEILRRQR